MGRRLRSLLLLHLRHPRRLWVAAAALTLLLGSGVLRVERRLDLLSLLPTDHPVVRASLEAAMKDAAREIRPEDHRHRSWLARLASAAAYSLVRILIGVTRYGGKQYID